MNQFKSRNSDFWKWVLYAGISLFILVVGWSIYHMTPTLLPIALAMCGASAAASLVYTVYTTVNASSLRRKAWIADALIVVGLIVNVIIHASLSRRFDVAQQAREARYVEEERDQQRKEAEHRRLTEQQEKQRALLERQSELLAEQRSLTEAQNRQLWMVSRQKRRLLTAPAAPVAEAPIETPVAPQTAPILTTGKPTAPTVEILTPEQVQEQSWWWVLFGILAEVGMIGATFIYFGRGLIGDTNKNGVADWIEELAPEELLAKYPDDYRRLYGEPPVRQNPFPRSLEVQNGLGK